MKTKFYFLFALTCALAEPLFSQELLPGMWVPNGRVATVSAYGDMVYVGGSFTAVTRSIRNGAIIDLASGEYRLSPFPHQQVDRVLPDYEGGFFINGFQLTHVNGVPRRKIAHIRNDGTLSDFNPPLPKDKLIVHLVATTPDRVFILTRGGMPQENALHCVDYAGKILWSRKANHRIYNAVAQNSILYIAGEFTSVEGQPRQRIAALDIHTGGILPFNTGNTIPSLRVASIETEVASNLISLGIANNELFIRYSATNTTLSRLISVNASTGESTGWSVASPTTSGDLAMMVYDNKIYLGSTTGNGLLIYDCVTKNALPLPALQLPTPSTNRIENFSADDTRITFTATTIRDNANTNLGKVVSFDSQTNQVTSHNLTTMGFVSQQLNQKIKSVAVSDGNLYCGGSFAGVQSINRMNFYAFNKVTNELSPLSFDLVSHDHEILKIIATEEKLFFTGYFSTVNGQPVTSDVVSADRLTGVLDNWSPEIEGSFHSLYLQGDGDLYIYGDFSSVNGEQRNNIARLDRLTGSLLDSELSPELEWIGEMAEHGDMLILAGRKLDTGYEIQFINRHTGDELLPRIEFNSDSYFTMKCQNSILYFGGSFTELTREGVQLGRDHLAAIDLTTGEILDLNIAVGSPGSFDENIVAMQVVGRTIYIGGNFNHINGESRTNLAAIDLETRQVTNWQPRAYGNVHFDAICVFADMILIGGQFTLDAPGSPTGYQQMHFGAVTPDRSNRISGRVFYDYNQNGIQEIGENGIPNILVHIQPGDKYSPTDEGGNYLAYTAAGEFSVTPVTPQYTTHVSPGSRDISFNGFDLHSASNDFGITVQPDVTDVSIQLTTDQSLRPGFFFNYIVTCKNEGTAVTDGTAVVHIDDRLLYDNISSVAPLSVDGNNLTFEFDNLEPGHSTSITINVRVPAPQVLNLLGEIVTTTAEVTPSIADNSLRDNTASLARTVVGSFDPNDKMVTPAGVGADGYIAENTQSLEYTIRFQNLGNAPATFVVITDQLDENLDHSSFTFVSSSHPNNFEIVNGTLTVNFGDINNSINLLPANVDEPASHGFFTYRIDLKDNLPRHTRIENSASIVFDFNLPIETNTVANTLLDPPYSTKVYLSDVTGERSSEVLLPVQVEDFEELLGQQFSLSWDPTVITFVGVEQFGLPGLDVASFNTSNAAQGQLTYAWVDPGAAAQTLENASTLFAIRFALTGNFGASTIVSITNHPTAVEAINDDFETIDVVRVDGLITISNDLTITGTILYPNNEPVQNVTVGLSGSSTQETSTDENGGYTFTVQASENSSYTITPSKSDDPNLLNGIDVQDLILIRRHILQVTTFTSPYEFIAADVSNNFSVSIQDLAILQALILGVETNFPNARQWAFVDAAHDFESTGTAFPYPQTATPLLTDLMNGSNVAFTAVKMGDVNLTRDNSQAGRTKAQEVVLEISPLKDAGDGVFELQVSAFGFVEISGYQFTMNWNAEELQWIDNEDMAINQSIGSHRADEGVLTAIWDDTRAHDVSVDDGTSLFKIRFRKVSETVNDKVTINSSATPLRMYNSALQSVSVLIRYGTGEEKIESGIFYPNPFRHETKISFSASDAQDARFQIVDVTGKEIHSNSVHVEKGWNEKTLSGDQLSPGVYIFNLQLRDKVIKGKMVKRGE